MMDVEEIEALDLIDVDKDSSELSNGSEDQSSGSIQFIGDVATPEDVLEDDDLEVLSESESVPAIEAMLLASGDPLAVSRICEVTGLSEGKVRDALESIQMSYECDENGFELVNVGGRFQFRTKAKYGRFVLALKESKPRRLSHAALETLAIVAYRQPVVKSDIEKIRGVDATPTLKTLLDKNLVKIVGHKEAVGQPALYGTGDEFLNLFGMSSLSDLPTLRDLKEFERDPGEDGTASDCEDEGEEIDGAEDGSEETVISEGCQEEKECSSSAEAEEQRGGEETIVQNDDDHFTTSLCAEESEEKFISSEDDKKCQTC